MLCYKRLPSWMVPMTCAILDGTHELWIRINPSSFKLFLSRYFTTATEKKRNQDYFINLFLGLGDENRASYMLHEHTTTEPYFQVNTFNFPESLHPLPNDTQASSTSPMSVAAIFYYKHFHGWTDSWGLQLHDLAGHFSTCSEAILSISLSSLMLMVRSQAFSISHTFLSDLTGGSRLEFIGKLI